MLLHATLRLPEFALRFAFHPHDFNSINSTVNSKWYSWQPIADLTGERV